MRSRRQARNLTGDVSKARADGGRSWRGRTVDDTFGDGEEWHERRELEWAAERPRRRETPQTESRPQRRAASEKHRPDQDRSSRSAPTQRSAARICATCGIALPATGRCDSCTD